MDQHTKTNGSIKTHIDDLCDALLKDFADLPKAGKTDLSNYGVINVSPPVVPNPYLPTFRVFSYNITNADSARAREDFNDVDDQLKKGRKP